MLSVFKKGIKQNHQDVIKNLKESLKKFGTPMIHDYADKVVILIVNFDNTISNAVVIGGIIGSKLPEFEKVEAHTIKHDSYEIHLRKEK